MNTRYWYWIWRTFLGPSRLRRKFLRAFLLSGLIPLILMGSVSVYLVSLTHRLDVISLERTVAAQVAADATSHIEEISSAFDLTVAFTEFAPVSFAAPDQQSFILQDILSRYPSAAEASFICLTPEQCTIGHETRRWIRTEAGISQSDDNRDVSTSPAFTTARSGSTYLGPITPSTNGFIMAIAKPITNGTGKVIGVLSGIVHLDPLQASVEIVRLGSTGYALLRNADGTIIAHPDRSQIGTSIPPTPDGGVYTNASGVSVTGVRAPLSVINAEVVVEWPRQETQLLIRTILYQIIGFSLFAFVLLIIIASWVALRLIQPIAQLRQGTSVIGAGNFNYRVQIKTGDELEDLGANLNKMAENLKGLDELKELRLRTDLLAESLKKEQEVNKLKDQFITTVSHQFNTPLSVINWALDALREASPKPEKLKETADIIAKSQHDIVGIVADLLTLSQIGFQYQKTNTKTIDVKALLQKIIAQFGDVAKARSITLSLESTAANPVVEGNEFTLTKAFENIVDNAIGYSDDNKRISINLADTTTDVTVSVGDSGIGIPSDDQPQIFQQFFRASNATAKKNVGTGLGLFIVKNVVSGHGGKVWFESKENQGSTFFVTLPKK